MVISILEPEFTNHIKTIVANSVSTYETAAANADKTNHDTQVGVSAISDTIEGILDQVKKSEKDATLVANLAQSSMQQSLQHMQQLSDKAQSVHSLLNSIIEGVETLDEEISQIAKATVEQNQSTLEISQNISSINENICGFSEDVGAVKEEVSQSVKMLNELLSSVGSIKV